MTNKERALREFLNLDKAQKIEFENDCFRTEGTGEEYLVLTDEEADQIAGDYIKESVWAFRADFLLGYLPEGMTTEAIEAIQENCESANSPILAMIGYRLEDFIQDAIASDGRGHFISTYDGNENEQGNFFIYRTN